MFDLPKWNLADRRWLHRLSIGSLVSILVNLVLFVPVGMGQENVIPLDPPLPLQDQAEPPTPAANTVQEAETEPTQPVPPLPGESDSLDPSAPGQETSDTDKPESSNPDQPEPANESAESTETEPDEPSEWIHFDELVTQIRTNERDINRLYSSITVGFPERQKVAMAKIQELKATNLTLQASLEESAILSFKADPKQNPSAAKHLFQLMANCMNGKAEEMNFNPAKAFKIGKLLTENDVAGPPVLYQAFRACYALQDYESAEKYLEKIEGLGINMQAGMREFLDDMTTKWQRELSIREQEEAADDLPRVKFETSEGEFTIELFEDHAPQTVGNFIDLVEKHFYDGLTFHEVRPGHFSTTGSPTANGQGDAGYFIPCETDAAEIRHFFQGSVGMAHNGKDTGGSRFFITHQPNKRFDGVYTCFGRVIEGIDVVYRLHRARPRGGANSISSRSGADAPSEIVKATVLRKREHEYKPTRLEKPVDPNSIFGSPGSPDTAPEN